MSKQYGLILTKKHTIGKITTRPSIFEDDSDSDTPEVKKPIGQTKSKKQDQLNRTKALEVDPTVYQYDEIYDQMDQKRKESKLSRKDLDKKPKYIGKLLQTAERRKRENERRIERQVQKEREAEGEEFRDKESFITSSYKKKLEEMKALDEAEKHEEYLESIGDVRKQGNLDGFYRHLYDQKVNYNDSGIKKEEPGDSETVPEVQNLSHSDKKVTQSDDSEGSNDKKERSTVTKDSGSSRKKRTYRNRKDTEEDAQEDTDEITEVKKEHLPSNLDADSDFSIDSSSDEDEGDNDKKDKESIKKDDIEVTTNKEEKGNVLSDNAAIAKANVDAKDKDNDLKKTTEEVTKEEIIEEPKPKKPKNDIWKKRTVGEVFDAALKRYFERKALRDSLQG